MAHKLYTIKPKSFGIEESSRHYPSIYIDGDDFPTIKNWEVGKKYKLSLVVKQTSKSERKEGKVEANFDILKIGEANHDTKEEYSLPK